MLYIESDNTIRLTRGDTARITIDITDSQGQQREILDTDVLIMSVKESINSSAYLFQKKVTGSNTIHIKPEDTESLEFGKYKYDVQYVTGNDVYTIVEPSRFEIMSEVTTTWQ